MRLRDEIQSDLRTIEREMSEENPRGTWAPQTFTWKQAEIPCTPTSLRKGQLIELGGNLYTVDLTLIVRKDEFLTADSTLITVDSELFTADNDRPHPVAGRTLIFRGTTFRIITARESGPRSHYELSLADEGSNR